MKKFLSMLLALVMVLSLGTVAFADELVQSGNKTLTAVVDTVAEENDDGVAENEYSFDVKTKAAVDDGHNYADIVYSVKVDWTVTGDTVDVLTGGLYKWNPENLKYELQGENDALALGTRNSVDVEIDFENRSNAAVDFAIEYADNNDDLTTSEAAKEGSSATGTIANADTQTGVATVADAKTGHDFTINAEAPNLTAAGTAGTAKYEATVTIESIANGATIADDQELTLGTYTVTLSAYVATVE